MAAPHGGRESQKVQITVMLSDCLTYVGPHSSTENVTQYESTHCNGVSH